MPQQCEAHFTTLPLSPPPSPTLTAPRHQETLSVLDDDICIYAAQSPEEHSYASTAPRQSSRVIYPQHGVLPSPRFWVALVLSAAAVGWAGWRLALHCSSNSPHDTENQVATGVLAFVFALWLPSPA